jgi:hypothetical protein
MTFNLPPTDTDQPPLFADLTQCRAWLKTLPLSNPSQAQAQLLRQLNLLNRYQMRNDVRLEILESLREPIHFVQGEQAKKYTGKPLPLAAAEQSALDAAHALWQGLADGYLRCLNACLAHEEQLDGKAGLICQRALAALSDDHTDLLRAGLQPESEYWRRAHRIYASAESLQATTVVCEDGHRSSQPTSPALAYAELMLIHAASLHELPPRQQQWIMRWARRWAGKVTIHTSAPPLDTPALPLCVDLEGDAPAGFKPQSGPGARWLETTELRKSLKRRLKLLAEGGETNTPARLGLGEDCPQPYCGEVLRRIYPRWVKGGILRRHERHPMRGACRFVVGVEAIHYYVADHHPFKPPGSTSSDDLRRQREEIATFGRVAARFDDAYSEMHGFQLENWEIVEDWGMLDQSSGGLRLVRPRKQEGGRLGVGQLVAVQPTGAGSLMLGATRWAQIAGDSLSAGIQLFPGKPIPIGIRATGVMAAQEKYRQAFLLPPVDSLKIPASVVLPTGSFKLDRIMETWTETALGQVKLKALLDRGADFERAACEVLPPR